MEWKPRRDVIRNKVRDVTFGRVLYSLRREAWRRGIGRTRRYVRMNNSLGSERSLRELELLWVPGCLLCLLKGF